MEKTHLAKTHEILVPMFGKFAQDQVVLDLDLEQLPGPDQVPRDANVCRTWRRIPAGMVVGQDDG